ncbi:MAG TPA: ADP-ribosylglycohydrolase family protein [Dermatophilaceae bacterium]|nr:ADP-ribosylglycohydrolase family protein [Dermatophilaceae bacterium]HQH90589.1 ADP-ribosylglycohydrolase family protein [Dermatophilaceae bacterium]
MTTGDRLRGGIFGLLVGDALGVPYEFHPATQIPATDEIEMVPPAGFARAHAGIAPGTWSDDGAQALVLLESLLRVGHLDVDDVGRGLVAWDDEGRYAVDRHVFDIGIQTGIAIRSLRAGVPAASSGPTDSRANGNGSLMRVLPLALWHRGSDADLAADAMAQSAVTHGHLRSQVCCVLYCLLARRLLHGMPPAQAWPAARAAFDEVYPAGSPEHDELVTHVFPDGAAYEIRGGGYVVESMRAAVALLLADDPLDYERVVKAAIALGEDTDTTACIAGGLAGIVAGEGGIPLRWRTALRGRDLVEPLADALVSWRGSA